MQQETAQQIRDALGIDGMANIANTDAGAYDQIMNTAEGIEPTPQEPNPVVPPSNLSRSEMSREEKLAYIKAHGNDGFMALKA